jgi:hypothetical protein
LFVSFAIYSLPQRGNYVLDIFLQAQYIFMAKAVSLSLVHVCREWRAFPDILEGLRSLSSLLGHPTVFSNAGLVSRNIVPLVPYQMAAVLYLVMKPDKKFINYLEVALYLYSSLVIQFSIAQLDALLGYCRQLLDRILASSSDLSRLNTLVKAHLKLTLTCLLIHKTYSFQSFNILSTTFINILSCAYYLISHFMYNKDKQSFSIFVFTILLWLGNYIIQFYVIISSYTSTATKVNSTFTIQLSLYSLEEISKL